MTDFEAQLTQGLDRCFGSEEGFDRFLGSKEREGFMPLKIEALGREVLDPPAGFVPERGAQGFSPDEVMSGLRRQSVDWGRAIREGLEQAESKWPTVVESHRAVLDRIKKVWK
jgi:hypothetical protein